MQLGGVIDSDYEGEIFVILFNHGKEIFKISKGMRIAQIIAEQLAAVSVKCQGHNTDSEPQIIRPKKGNEGFGSTNYLFDIPSSQN